MTISSTLRVPFVAVEIDNTRAEQGASLLAYEGLLIGQKIGSGSATANTIVRATDEEQVIAACGRGSILHRQYLAWRGKNKATPVWMGVLDDNTAGVHATGTFPLTGTATEAGTISAYVGGTLVEVAVASGDTASTVASALASAIGKHSSGTVTFATAASGDNITVGATTFIATTGAVTPGAATYCYDTGNNAAAASFVAQVNAHAVASTVVFASASSAVVTLRAIAGGTAGNSVVLTSVDGATTAVTGSGTLSGASSDTDMPVHATVSSGTVTVIARNRGTAGNEIDLRLNYQDGEELPAGLACTPTAMTAGASNPSLTTLIAALGDQWFQVMTMPYTDSTSLTSIENELADRFDSTRMIDGVCYTAKEDTLANRATLGNTRNSPHVSISRTYKSPTPSFEESAHIAAAVALEAQADPAMPLQTVTLPWVLAPAEADLETLEERDSLLHDGISTTKVAAGGMVQIERLITTYKTNGAGADDESYLDVTTMHTLLYLRYSFRTWIQSRYPRAKLASDGTRFGSGQKVITPKIAKGECLSWFREMESLGLVEDFAGFKANLDVTRDQTDSNRLNFTLPPDLINQFIVGAVNLQFRL